jgi:UDP-galactopyranose mutase
MQYDYVIVGSGLFGSVFAQQAHEHGKRVLVLEKRSHVGGNCYTYEYEDTGIVVHAYGTHIFHTSDGGIWKYVRRFTRFNRYRHRVLTTTKDGVFAMPINLGTINAFFGVNLNPAEAGEFLQTRCPRIACPRNLEEQAVSQIGTELYDAFIKGYTRKQWGCDPRDLPASIIKRLPIRTSYNDSYFDDTYQGIPVDGYTPMFRRMLEGIPLELGVDFLENRDYWFSKSRRVVYTGPVDGYFDHCFGRLSWRSVRFEVERHPVGDFQGTSVMNYAGEEVQYTRIHEPKHLHLEKTWNNDATVIMKEYPCTDPLEPYYPVNFDGDQARLRKYATLQEKEGNVIFGGRLARYKYFDMHQVIGSALVTARRELGRQHIGDSSEAGQQT